MPAKTISVDNAQRYLKRYLPAGWVAASTESLDKNLDGLCNWDRKLIFCPTIKTVYNLCVFLHEVYHANHHEAEARSLNPRQHLMEYEAEMWSMKKAQRLGYRVTPYITMNARMNVRMAIRRDRKAGVVVDPRIQAWSRA